MTPFDPGWIAMLDPTWMQAAAEHPRDLHAVLHAYLDPLGDCTFWRNPYGAGARSGVYLWDTPRGFAFTYLDAQDTRGLAVIQLLVSRRNGGIITGSSVADLALTLAADAIQEREASFLAWEDMAEWPLGFALSRLLERVPEHDRPSVLAVLVLQSPDFARWWDRYTRVHQVPGLRDQARMFLKDWTVQHYEGRDLIAPEWLAATHANPAAWNWALASLLTEMRGLNDFDLDHY